MSEQYNPAEAEPLNRVERFLENGAAESHVGAQEASSPAQVQAPVAARLGEVASPRVTHGQGNPRAMPETAKSGSSCECGQATRNLVYALGQIDIDFGTEARRDSFIQQGVRHPHNPQELLDHLDSNPWCATAVIWTLVQETTPIYAIRPTGAFAEEAYHRLRGFLRGQLVEGVSQVSIPGSEAGKVRLINGQEVPVLIPEIRGMYSWSTPALVEAVLGKPLENECEEHERQSAEVGNFLDRVYFEIGNLGVSPQERAVNYAATNAYQVATVYRDAIKQNLKLDRIGVERSSVCRPGSDCWDVKLSFFDPCQRHEKAKEIYRFTIDVSEVVPVTVGKVRRWSAY